MKKPMMFLWVLIFVFAFSFAVTKMISFVHEAYDFWRQLVVIEIGDGEIPDSLIWEELPNQGEIVSFSSPTTLYHSWTVNLDEVENRENWTITIEFDGNEFLFSYDEFKMAIERFHGCWR